MYSDIIPPKKNNLATIKATPKEEVRILKDEPLFTGREIYHTMDGRDRRSKWPMILILTTLAILGIVYYSVFNDNTKISFESKSTIFEIKDNIPMSMSEKNQAASTTLSYNLIYNNEIKDRNIFAPIVEESTSTLKAAEPVTASEYYNLNTATTSPFTSIKVALVNESNVNVQVIKDTRFDVNGTTYYLEKAVNIKPTKTTVGADQAKYKVIGFKNTANYDKFYAIDYVDAAAGVGSEVATADTANSESTGPAGPNDDILSLIPENFISLKKNYVFDNAVNQSALIVIDKRDFEKVLLARSKIVQDYVESLKPVADLLEYQISVNDYELQLDAATGLPVSFKNLVIEIKPIIKRDRVASTFKGFSKESMKKIKNDIAKQIELNVTYSPFWVSKVSDEDHISVEVK